MNSSETGTSGAPRRGQGWKIAAGVVISLLFFGLALYQIDLKQLGTVFRQVNPWWVSLAGVFVLSSYYLRALLWRQLIGRRRRVHLWNLFRIITLGYLANNLLPLKLGEILRAWLLGRKENLPTSLAIGTVVLERMMDLFTLLFYFTGMMFFVPFAPWLKLSGLLLAGAGMVLLGVVIISHRYGDRLIGWLEKPLQALPGKAGIWVHEQIAKFMEGLRLIETPKQMAAAFGWCLLTWLSWICMAYVCILAFGVKVPFLAAVFLMVVLNFGLMIPSSPGGLGVFEFMVILALTPYGVSKEAALGVGFTFHMLQYLLTFIIGWIFALQMNVSLTKVYQHPENPSGD